VGWWYCFLNGVDWSIIEGDRGDCVWLGGRVAVAAVAAGCGCWLCGCGGGSVSGWVAVHGCDCFLNGVDRSIIEGDSDCFVWLGGRVAVAAVAVAG
jgi:hypothetical protein